MTFEFFEQQMARLMGLRFRPAELQTHWEALSDMPDAALEQAVTYAQRTRIDFPTPRELRQDADLVKAATAPIVADEREPVEMEESVTLGTLPNGHPVVASRIWNYYCDECKDGGWESVWCGDIKAPQRKPWEYPATCERRKAHGPHQWSRKCRCWDTNPALVKKREAAEKFANAPKPQRAA